jgi:hypothetical protein
MSYQSSSPGADGASNHHRGSITRCGASRARTGECPVCLGQHEDDIHSATLRVRRWFRTEVTKGFSRRAVC